MQYKVVVTVIDKKLYPELQAQYCIDPKAGPCPVYNVGDTFVFERYGERDDFWHIGLNTLKKTNGEGADVAGGTVFPHRRGRGALPQPLDPPRGGGRPGAD